MRAIVNTLKMYAQSNVKYMAKTLVIWVTVLKISLNQNKNVPTKDWMFANYYAKKGLKKTDKNTLRVFTIKVIQSWIQSTR